MFLDRIGYELRLMWRTALPVPLLTVALLGGLALLLHALHQDPAHVLLGLVEMLLPLAAGVAVATTLAHDHALELQLTVPAAFPRTSLLRLGLIALWTALLALPSLVALGALGLLHSPSFVAGWNLFITAGAWQLVWAVPLLWFCGIGVCLALLTHSRSASGTMLGGIWLLDCLFVGVIAHTIWLRPFLLFPATLVLFPATPVSLAEVTTYWLNTRLWLLGMVVALLPLSWALLHDNEGLLKGAGEA